MNEHISDIVSEKISVFLFEEKISLNKQSIIQNGEEFPALDIQKVHVVGWLVIYLFIYLERTYLDLVSEKGFMGLEAKL